MARGRKSRGSRSGPKNQVWTTIVNVATTISSGATKTGTDIVTSADWTAVGGSERATILRIRGWCGASVDVPAGAFAGGAVFGYIGLYDEDELSKDASLALTYLDEDIMTTFGHTFAAVPAGGIIPAYNHEIDVKAMRKIRTGIDCRFVATNITAEDMNMSLVIRALVRRGGN